jgi:hypothetical protein
MRVAAHVLQLGARVGLVSMLIAVAIGTVAQASGTAPLDKGQRLFIAGHSFNVFICAPLESLATEAGIGGHTTYGVQFIGNSTPMQHWTQGTEESNIAKRALRTGELDVLTLSPNATLPEEAIDKFADLAQQTNPNIRLLVQQSWAAWDGNAPNLGSLRPSGGAGPGPGPRPALAAAPEPAKLPAGCPPPRAPRTPAPGATGAPTPPPTAAAAAQTGFQNSDRDGATAAQIEQARQNYQGYMDRMRAQLKGINERHDREMAFIVPAAEAVNRLRLQVIAGKVPGVSKQSELFADAMGHAGPAVSDLVSYVWFATLYRRSPVGLTALDKEKSDASQKRHRLLQEIAWQSVLDEPMSGVK